MYYGRPIEGLAGHGTYVILFFPKGDSELSGNGLRGEEMFGGIGLGEWEC